MTNSNHVKRGLVGVIILAIFVLTFLIIKPIAIPIIFGLLFAYIFRPIHKKLKTVFKNKNISTTILVTTLVVLIALPVIYIVPIIVNQTFDTYVMLQNLNLAEVIDKFLSEDMASTLATNLDNIIGATFSSFLTQFKNLLINLPTLIFQFVVFLFTFYFATRDSAQLQEYLSSLSPFSKATESRFLREFRGITNAIIFGQVFIGVLQGLALGAGLFLLEVPKVLILTVMAIILSVIPILGSWLVWLPVSIFLLVTGETFAGVFLILYGALFVSSIDNLIRPYLLSKKSTLPIALSLIGTIGGLFFFGIIGLVLGPLIIAYTLIIIEFYRQGKLKDLFNRE